MEQKYHAHPIFVKTPYLLCLPKLKLRIFAITKRVHAKKLRPSGKSVGSN